MPGSIRSKELEEVSDEFSRLLFPLVDQVMALLLHSVDKVFGLFLHSTDRLFHFVHLVLKSVLFLLDKTNIKFLCCVASLQVAPNIDVIISDDASDQIGRGDALCPLSGHKHSCFLYVFVNVL